MNKLFKTLSAGLVATGLLSALLPVASTFAASPSDSGSASYSHRSNARHPGTFGTVMSMALNADGSGTLQLQVKKPNAQGNQGTAAQNGQTLTIAFTKDVKLSLRDKTNAVWNDILVGDNVGVQGSMANNSTSTFNATKIHDMSAFATVGKRVFTVTGVDLNNHTLTATVKTNKGDLKTVKIIYSSATTFTLGTANMTAPAVTVGSTITIKGISHRDASGNATIYDVSNIAIHVVSM